MTPCPRNGVKAQHPIAAQCSLDRSLGPFFTRSEDGRSCLPDHNPRSQWARNLLHTVRASTRSAAHRQARRANAAGAQRAAPKEDQLRNSSKGLWFKETISGSSHLLDLDSRVILRQAGPSGEDDGMLRRDGDSIRLLDCEDGNNILFLVDLNAPGVLWTTRISTTVLTIEGMDPRTWTSGTHRSRKN